MEYRANLVDIHNRCTKPSIITVEGGRIVSIELTYERCEHYILPGFVDAHIHIESSMLPPCEFARLAVTHGTLGAVCDPHEIANVMGLEGVKYMIAESHKTPFKFIFGASPCVPATLFETSGDSLGVDDIATLLDMPEIGFLSEVMNFPAVLSGDEDILSKIALAKEAHKPIDGHAPALVGDELARYIEAEISTDHEAFGYEEGEEKLQKGMKILIREGSAAKNFEALHPLIDRYYSDMMFCSDDKHPDDLMRGHIDELVRRAISLGHDLYDVLQMATLNPIEHYGLDIGMLRVGDSADFIVVEDLSSFRVVQSVISGEVVARDGKTLLPYQKVEPINRFDTQPKRVEEFYLPKCNAMEVIGVVDHELMTYESIAKPSEDDILKIAVINRYSNTPIQGIAHVRGFGLSDGAIASSVAHDSHNIIVVGSSDKAMAEAVNLIIEARGGISAVSSTESHLLPLEIAGIMSSADGFEVASRYEELDRFAKESLGSPLGAPFMTLSFMALLVIPELKLSDKGLFDGRDFHFISPCRDG